LSKPIVLIVLHDAERINPHIPDAEQFGEHENVLEILG